MEQPLLKRDEVMKWLRGPMEWMLHAMRFMSGQQDLGGSSQSCGTLLNPQDRGLC